MPVSEKDYAEILHLAGRYAFAIDHNKPEEWADCFTSDGSFESNLQGRFTGREDLVYFCETVMAFCESEGQRPRHWNNQWVIEVEGNKAVSKCYALIIDASNFSTISVGQYNDKLIRENGEWLFKERIYNFDGEIDPSLSEAMKELFKDKPSEK